MLSISAKIAILVFVGLWIFFNLLVFPIIPQVQSYQSHPAETTNSILYVNIFFCLIPSIIIYIIARFGEYLADKMTN